MSDTSQGPGWWQASDGKWYPPEQAPGPAATTPPAPSGPPLGGPPPGGPPPGYAAPAGAPGGGGSVSPTEPFSYAFNKFTQNLGPILSAIVVFIGVWFLSFLVLFFLRWNTSSLLLSIIFDLVGIFVYLLVTVGVIRMALKVVDGQELTPEGLFSTDQLGEYLVAALILTVPFLFCYLPGVVVLFFAGFFGFFIVDQKQGAIDAIKSSFSLVTQNIGTVIVFELLAGVMLVVGYCFCLVGTFVALPVVIIAQACLYRRLTGGNVAP